MPELTTQKTRFEGGITVVTSKAWDKNYNWDGKSWVTWIMLEGRYYDRDTGDYDRLGIRGGGKPYKQGDSSFARAKKRHDRLARGIETGRIKLDLKHPYKGW